MALRELTPDKLCWPKAQFQHIINVGIILFGTPHRDPVLTWFQRNCRKTGDRAESTIPPPNQGNTPDRHNNLYITDRKASLAALSPRIRADTSCRSRFQWNDSDYFSWIFLFVRMLVWPRNAAQNSECFINMACRGLNFAFMHLCDALFIVEQKI